MDDPELWESYLRPHTDGGRRLNVTLRIKYRNSKGVTSFRTVDVTHYSRIGAGHGAIHGHCHKRKEGRTFCISRIETAVDMASMCWLDSVGKWLDDQYFETAAGKYELLMTEHGTAVEVLFSIAKADKVFRSKEQEVIRRFLRWACTGATDRLLEYSIDQVKRWEVPTAVGFGRSARALAEKGDEYKSEIWDAANEIVATDKDIVQAEAHLLERLRKTLGMPKRRRRIDR